VNLNPGQIRLREAIDAVVEALDLLSPELRGLESSDAVRRFNAYHLAEVEGNEGGEWLVSDTLHDALIALRADVAGEATAQDPPARWTSHAEYAPEAAGFTSREMEILDEHAGELDADLGAHKWGPLEMRAYIADRRREELGLEPDLAAELGGIIAKYEAADAAARS
jgi:hypothetical protein